jgi:glutathione S-transferase
MRSSENGLFLTALSQPLLYSFRRCPYAIRARLAIGISEISVAIREVDLKAKPECMLQLSPKGTVPILVLPNGEVLDESLDIMLWALQQNDPLGMLDTFSDEARALIERNDTEFKHALDRYKYPQRYPEFSMLHYRAQGEIFLCDLNVLFEQHASLCSDKAGLADLALMPFVRQFAQVDRHWFDASSYCALRKWLAAWEASDFFHNVMQRIKL